MVDDFLSESILAVRFNIVKRTVIPYHEMIHSGDQHTAFCEKIHPNVGWG